jgi:hypothetical protein
MHPPCLVLHRTGFSSHSLLPENAVVSYTAVSLLTPQSDYSSAGRSGFCSTFRLRASSSQSDGGNTHPALIARRPVLWCPDFPLQFPGAITRSSFLSKTIIAKVKYSIRASTVGLLRRLDKFGRLRGTFALKINNSTHQIFPSAFPYFFFCCSISERAFYFVKKRVKSITN